jgi:hypothetical protein
VTFHGDVDISDCVFSGSVSFAECDFLRNLKLDNTKIEGALSLRGAIIRGGASYTGKRFREQFSLQAAGVSVKGDLTLDLMVVSAARIDGEDGSFDGGVCLSNAMIEGDLTARGTELDGQLAIANAKVLGNLHLGSLYDPAQEADVQGRFRFGVDAHNIRVSGEGILEGVTSGADVSFWGSQFESSFFIIAYFRLGQFDTSFDESDLLPENFHITYVAQELNFSFATIRGHLKIRSVRVEGPLSCKSATIDELSLSYEGSERYPNHSRLPCSVGSLDLNGCCVRTSVALNALRVTDDAERPGISISGATIGADLRFWSHDMLGSDVPQDDPRFDPLDIHAVINGPLRIDGGTTIGGTLDLTNVVVNGPISVRDSKVTHDLRFGSTVSLLNDPRDPTERALARRIALDMPRDPANAGRAAEKKPLCGALAHALDLSMLTCEGDVDLTGLVLDGAPERGQGGIKAHHLTVKGGLNLQLVHRCPEKLFDTPPVNRKTNYCHTQVSEPEDDRGGHRHVAFCRVPGFGDFSNVEATTLRVSAHSFDARETGPASIWRRLRPCPARRAQDMRKKAKVIGLRLAGAKIGELEIVDLQPGEHTISGIEISQRPGDRDFFPSPIDIGDIEVGVWTLGEEERPRAARFARLLGNDPWFRRASYRMIETGLRNRGHERDADEIYRAMNVSAEMERRQEACRRLREWRMSQLAVVALAVALFLAVVAVALANTLAAIPAAAPWLARLPPLVQWSGAVADQLRGWLGLAWIVPLLAVAVLFSRFRYYAYRFLLGFGTRPLVVLIVIFGLWLVMLPAYFQRENFGPSLAALATTADPPADSEPPTAEDWTRLTAVFVSFNYHVPMLNLMVREQWGLKDSGGLLWRLPLLGGRVWTMPAAALGRITPEDWGALMIALNWILWPLVLTFLIRKAVRGAQD